jgi:hypothetical protein
VLPPSTLRAATARIGGWVDAMFDGIDRAATRTGLAMRRAMPRSVRG